jgi:hypothetical protein
MGCGEFNPWKTLEPESSLRMNLDERIQRWRGRLASTGTISGGALDEMESGLRDSVAARMAGGLEEDAAFGEAERLFGTPEAVAAEFSKIDALALSRGCFGWMVAGAVLLSLWAGFGAFFNLAVRWVEYWLHFGYMPEVGAGPGTREYWWHASAWGVTAHVLGIGAMLLSCPRLAKCSFARWWAERLQSDARVQAATFAIGMIASFAMQWVVRPRLEFVGIGAGKPLAPTVASGLDKAEWYLRMLLPGLMLAVAAWIWRAEIGGRPLKDAGRVMQEARRRRLAWMTMGVLIMPLIGPIWTAAFFADELFNGSLDASGLTPLFSDSAVTAVSEIFCAGAFVLLPFGFLRLVRLVIPWLNRVLVIPRLQRTFLGLAAGAVVACTAPVAIQLAIAKLVVTSDSRLLTTAVFHHAGSLPRHGIHFPTGLFFPVIYLTFAASIWWTWRPQKSAAGLRRFGGAPPSIA